MSDTAQGLLDMAALATNNVPVVGDGIGLLADAVNMIRNPQERTWANGLLALGSVVPFIPSSAATRTAKKLPDVMEYASKVKDSLGLRKLNVSERSGDIVIDMIEVAEKDRGRGIGSQAMDALTSYADATGRRIRLTPEPIGGGSSRRLQRFYERFGFRPNTGRARDLSVMETMLRDVPR